MASDAVGNERISRVVGYKIKKGDFRTTSPNLPQRIVILGEANEANQATLDLTPKEITSAQQAGQLYGFGSPIHMAARILRPISGEGVGGVPVIVYPQAKAVGAAAKVLDITPTGTATANGTHTLKVAGRTSLDGVFYDINILAGDTEADIAEKIEDAINNILGSPVSAISTVTKATATAKWNGLTSQDLSITVDTNGNSLGITYVVSQVTAGSGTPSVQAALDLFDNDWNTIVINCYGTVTSVMTALEVFNGKADPTNPTGRYAGIIMKPFVALTGSVADDPSSITDARLNEMTIAICPAPLSKGLPLEAAANYAVLQGKCSQNTPQLDINGQSLPDMPTPAVIGSMSDYENRDAFVKKGCSTVDLIGGAYVVQDFVTTYHPVGETPPQFRYVRNLTVDFNVRYGYYLLEQINVVDHVIANDNDVVTAEKVIKPKMWKQVVSNYSDDLSKRGLIVDPTFMKDSLTVNLGTSNPDRLETFFRYKRSGVVRIASTTAEAGFNFGSIN
jgi:phage tail sheath gpL-like